MRPVYFLAPTTATKLRDLRESRNTPVVDPVKLTKKNNPQLWKEKITDQLEPYQQEWDLQKKKIRGRSLLRKKYPKYVPQAQQTMQYHTLVWKCRFTATNLVKYQKGKLKKEIEKTVPVAAWRCWAPETARIHRYANCDYLKCANSREIVESCSMKNADCSQRRQEPNREGKSTKCSSSRIMPNSLSLHLFHQPMSRVIESSR